MLLNYCPCVFPISHGGCLDSDSHLKTKKHNSSVEAAVSSSRVTHFFETAHSDESLHLEAKKATFAYYTATHGQSFLSSDCTSELVSKFFEPKFANTRSKCESALLHSIAPMIAAELRQELDKANFISVTLDASNRKEVKIIPVANRYFVPEVGVKVKLLKFKSPPRETVVILNEYLVLFLEKNELKEKFVEFCTDNCNINFGGVKRRGQNIVFFKAKKNIRRDLTGIGCAAHVVHNCLQHAVDNLLVYVESLAVKMYKFFHITLFELQSSNNFVALLKLNINKPCDTGVPGLCFYYHLFIEYLKF